MSKLSELQLRLCKKQLLGKTIRKTHILIRLL